MRYAFDETPAPDLIADLYARAGLRRPVRDVERIRRMYAGSNVITTAYDDQDLVGIVRGWTDAAYVGYVCDLAVDPSRQSSGIGRELLRLTTERYPDVQFVLRASAVAERYYDHLGWQKIENGWYWPRPPWE